MKIYFIYRSAYIPNSRHTKAFEANTVLDWFKNNWQQLNDDEGYSGLLGISHVYGFPFSDYKDGQPISEPSSLTDLRDKIEKYVYSNEVHTQEHCVEVHTDDDEIELMWAVFDEIYLNENKDKVSVWFNDELPVSFSDTLFNGEVDSEKVSPEGKEGSCRTYYLSSSIYDSGNFEDLYKPHVLTGVSLPGLLDYFRNSNDINTSEDDESYYRKTEIAYLQQLCKLYPDKDLKDIITTFSKINFTEINDNFDEENMDKVTVEFLEEKEKTSEGKSIARVSSHLIEVMIHWSEFYDYVVIFDDYWANTHPELARSLFRFHETWEV